MTKKGIISALLPGAIAFSLAAAACTGAPGTENQTTTGADTQRAQTIATQAVPTAAAFATQAVPTVAAVATQVAPQVQAAGTAIANVPLRISDLRASNDEILFKVQNAGSQEVSTNGWMLRVGNQSFAMPMAANLAPGAAITVHTGMGTNTQTDIFLGEDMARIAQAFANEPTVAVVGPDNQVLTQATVPQALLGR